MVRGPGQGGDEGVARDVGSAVPDEYPVNPPHPAVSHRPHPTILIRTGWAGHQLHGLLLQRFCALATLRSKVCATALA